MKIKYKICIALSLLASLWLVTLSGCEALQTAFQNPNYIYEDGAVLVGGDNKPIELLNQPEAADINYDELITFLREDPTDEQEYIPRITSEDTTAFVCSDFARMLHNNAEAAGIRTAYVGVDWEDGSIGHAINAFETIDKGLVYIDCTGRSEYSQMENGETAVESSSWDKIAYIEIGKKYGVIGLDYAKWPDYAYFEEYDQKWQEYKEKLTAYNAEVRRYNQEIEGKRYRQGSREYAQIKEWEDRLIAQEEVLNELKAEIGDSRFKPLGIVKSVIAHW